VLQDATVDVTSPGFEANLTWFFGAQEEFVSSQTGHAAYAGITSTWVYNPGTGDANLQIAGAAFASLGKGGTVEAPNSVTDVYVSDDGYVSPHPDAGAYELGGGLRFAWDVTGFDASGFTITHRLNDSNADGENDNALGWMAMVIPDREITVGVATTPTATGVTTFSSGNSNLSRAITGTPEWVELVASKAQAANAIQRGADGEVWGLVTLNGVDAASLALADDHASATCVANSVHGFDTGVIDINDGSPAALWDAAFDSFSDGAFALNFSATNGTARLWPFISISEATSSGHTSTGSLSLSAITASASGHMVPKGDADILLGQASLAAVGEMPFQGVAAATVAPASMTAQARMHPAGTAGTPAAQPQGVDFDGTNDYLTRGADLTGNADGKLFTWSFWFRTTASSGVVYQNDDGSVNISLGGTGALTLFGFDAGFTVGFQVNTSDGLNDGAWHHCCGSVDTANVANRHLYIDDASDAAWAIYADGAMNFTEANHAIGATTVGGTKFNGDLADVYLNFA
jgi:hypothetical protein